MKPHLVLIASALLALGGAACSTANVVPPGSTSDQYKSAADAAHSNLSFISPNDPRYEENGAPRAGEPAGIYVAGDPSSVAFYAPIYHRSHAKGGATPQ